MSSRIVDKVKPVDFSVLLMDLKNSSLEHVDNEHLFTSVLAGSGIMASISMAMVLQALYPASLFLGLPIAGCVGLAFGWTVAYPAARVLVWHCRDVSGDIASAAAIGMSLLLSLPACVFSSAIGLSGSTAIILLIGVMVGVGGLFFGGYLVSQRREESR